MRNNISSLPIVVNRKATIYEGVGGDCTTCFGLEFGGNVILTSDGTNVEYWNGIFFDERCIPSSELQIELDITTEEFMELTQGDDTYVDLILVDANHVLVFITTQNDTIYDKVHTIR